MDENIREEVREIAVRAASEEAIRVSKSETSRAMWAIVSLFVAIIGLFITHIFVNGNRVSKIETSNDHLIKTVDGFIKEQRDYNSEFRKSLLDISNKHNDDIRQLENTIVTDRVSYSDRLDDISDDQKMVKWKLQQLYPNAGFSVNSAGSVSRN